MNNSLKISVAVLAVAAIGGLAGILLAPDEGKKTRNKLSKKGKKLWKASKKTADKLFEKSADLKDKVFG